MRIFIKSVLLLIVLILNNNTLKNTFSSENEIIDFKTIFILKHRWHTGIIIKTDDVKNSISAVANDFKNTQYIEIGWGDKNFYMAEKETVWLALKAVLWPTESVLHVAEINQHPLIQFNNHEIVELFLSTEDYNEIISYINQSFELDANNQNIKLSKGLYSNSYFYLSKEKYHLFKTCNVWTAKGLKKGNVKINPSFALTSKNLIKQLKRKN